MPMSGLVGSRSGELEILSPDGRIGFGRSGNMRRFQPAGFCLDDEFQDRSWSEAPICHLTWLRSAPWSRLFISADPFLHPGRLDRQELVIYLNGLFIGMMVGRARGPTEAEFPIPVLGRGGSECLLTLVAPYAASPIELGASAADERKLGWCFVSIALGR